MIQTSALNRTPPANLEAEQAILGSILANNECFQRVAETLKPEHFADPLHGKLYDAMARLIGRGQVVSAFSLKTYVESDPDLKAVGGVSYLARLLGASVDAADTASYAALVRDQAIRRKLIDLAQQLTLSAYEPQPDDSAASLIERTERGLYDLAAGNVEGGFQSFAASLTESVTSAETAYRRAGGLAGLSTGFRHLDRMLGGLHKSDLVVIAGRPSMGKAQPLGARVLLRDGSWKAMGDLRLGDDLASIDGAPSRVAGVFPQGRREVFEVVLQDGRKTRACGEHLWAIESCKFERRRVVSTAALAEMLTKERYRGRISFPLASGHFGIDRNIAIDPWLLGVLIGNGCMTEGHLSVSTADAATLHRVQDVLGAQLKAANASGYDYRIPRGSESSVARSLEAYGLMGKRSEQKFIPEPYKRATRETRMELLRGLLDTDGSVEKHGSIRYGTSSRQLALDVQGLVRSLGGACSVAEKSPIYTYRGERREGLPAYVCNIAHTDRASLLTLTRKRRRCPGDMRFHVPTVASITSCGVEEVQCIRVTHGSSLYVTDDYIATHNTALATNIAVDVAWTGARVGFFSLEMSCEQLATRIVADKAGIPSNLLREGKLTGAEFDRVMQATQSMEALPLAIDDTPALSIASLRTRARRLRRKEGLDLVVVDYLQLVDGDDRRKRDGRVQEVSEITRGLKALAKELDVPVLALSQLSRNVEGRSDKRPQLSDLRDSGSIEQDADVVMFVYREEYYLERSDKRGTPDHISSMGRADLIVDKQRHGPTGIVPVRFNAALTRFSDMDGS